MRNASILFLASTIYLVSACSEGGGKTSEGVTTSDTVISGLEGTRDQPGQLLTDVKPDTTSGQTEKVRSLGQQADSINGTQAGTSGNESFMRDAVAGNTEEVALAKLAVQQSSNQAIKSIARELQKQHTEALNELKALGKKENYTGSTSNGSLSNTLTGMRSKKGAAFDKTWCEYLIEKHKTTIAKYEQTASAMADGDLKQWITKTLPKLRMHNDHLMALHGKL